MTPNLIDMLSWLRGPAPRILRTHDIRRAQARIRRENGMEPSTNKNAASRMAVRMTNHGMLYKVLNGLYINAHSCPIPTLAECTQHMRQDAVVGLTYVLGQCGVLNNPPIPVIAILPNKPGKASRRVETIDTEIGLIRIFAMKSEMFYAGETEERMNTSAFYPTSTPEKAFLDVLYLSTYKRSVFLMPPMDSDITVLNQRRLRRLATVMNLNHKVDEFIEKKAVYDADEDVQANMSIALGF